MSRPQPNASERARGLLLGIACGVPDPDAWPDPLGRAVILAEELAREPVDLARVAKRWVEWSEDGAWGVGPSTASGFAHLAQWKAPPRALDLPPESATLAATLPVALAAREARASMVSGSYHVALLVHPDPVAAWCSVATVVAARQLLSGYRDILPDIIEVLDANDASDTVRSTLRRIPVLRQEDLRLGQADAPVHCMEAALWVLSRFGNANGVREWLNEAPSHPWLAALIYGLLGSREGEQSLPDDRLRQVSRIVHVRSVAKALIQPRNKDP